MKHFCNSSYQFVTVIIQLGPLIFFSTDCSYILWREVLNYFFFFIIKIREEIWLLSEPFSFGLPQTVILKRDF